MSCVTMMTVMPLQRFTSLMRLYSSPVATGSSPVTGSSSSRSLRVAHRARASSTRCCWPPESA